MKTFEKKQLIESFGELTIQEWIDNLNRLASLYGNDALISTTCDESEWEITYQYTQTSTEALYDEEQENKLTRDAEEKRRLEYEKLKKEFGDASSSS